jgi:predicted nucleic acid-binding Zn ribbon protein
MIAIDHFQGKKAVFQIYNDSVNEIPFNYLQPRGGPRTISPSFCKRCHKIFIRRSRTVKYCPNCKQDPEIMKNELQRKRKKERKDERPQRYCKNCGKPLPKGNLKGIYCKNKGKCRVAYYRKKLKRYDLFGKNVTVKFFSIFEAALGLD